MSVSDLLSAAAMVAQQSPIIIAWHGIIAPGSYDPVNGTVIAIVGTTLANTPDDATTTDNPLKVPCYLLSPYLGLQAGPVGGERCLLIPIEDNSYGCLVYNGPDDAPRAPAGEFWVQRDDPNTPPSQQKQFVRIQTDGATRIGGASKIALLGPSFLGDENLQSSDGVMRIADGQKLANDLMAAVGQMFQNLCQYIASGKGVPPPQTPSVTAQGSSKVFASTKSQ